MNIGALVPFGMSPESLILFMSGCSAAITVAAIWFGLLNRNPAGRRIKELAERREALRAGILSPIRRSERLKTTPTMHQVVQRLNLLRHGHGEKIAKKLAQAGWRSKDAVIRFLFFKLILPPVLGGITVLVLYGLNVYQLSPVAKIGVSLGSIILGFYAPDIFVRNTVSKRIDILRKSLPDALDLMVICSEAGLSLDATLKRVSDELEQAAPEISGELALTALELGFLPERRRALENLSERTGLKGLRAMVTTLLQAERYGTPLANSLRVLSLEFRDDRMMRAEEKAARLPALLTVPMIIFILPPLFVVLIGPAILDVVDALSKM